MLVVFLERKSDVLSAAIKMYSKIQACKHLSNSFYLKETQRLEFSSLETGFFGLAYNIDGIAFNPLSFLAVYFNERQTLTLFTFFCYNNCILFMVFF